MNIGTCRLSSEAEGFNCWWCHQSRKWVPCTKVLATVNVLFNSLFLLHLILNCSDLMCIKINSWNADSNLVGLGEFGESTFPTKLQMMHVLLACGLYYGQPSSTWSHCAIALACVSSVPLAEERIMAGSCEDVAPGACNVSMSAAIRSWSVFSSFDLSLLILLFDFTWWPSVTVIIHHPRLKFGRNKSFAYSPSGES